MASAFSPLLSVVEADRILAAFAGESGVKRPAEAVPLDAAVGRVLREDIRADRAYPAQDRSRMDGIAVSAAALASFPEDAREVRSFAIVGVARAGDARASLSEFAALAAMELSAPHSDGGLPLAACVEIMTGAPLPAGCDTVIPYEDIHIAGGAEDDPAAAGGPRTAMVRAGVTVRVGQFVHREGSDCAAGDVLVPAGTRLTAADIAIAASVGMPTLRVARRLRAAVVATGDELVGVDETPLAHQLRVSNAHGLAALLGRHAETRVHRVGDDPAALARVLRAVLSSFDLVLVSGGVSAGKYDLVPDTLVSLGVRKVFHKLAQKPGKPLWFGTLGYGSEETPGGPHSRPLFPDGTESARDETPSGERVVPPDPVVSSSPPFPPRSQAGETAGMKVVPVFGLPGNPVSALVCARRFVVPLVERMLGSTVAEGAFLPLGSPVEGPSRLTRYLPVKRVVRAGAGGFETVAEARAVNGSGDFATLGGSDGFVELAPSEGAYPGGTKAAFFGWST